MNGIIKVNFSELESDISEISRQYTALSDLKVLLLKISTDVKETWEDPACTHFEEVFEDMRDDSIPQALVLLDTMQTLLEAVCSTYRETDQNINAMIG